MGCRWQFTAYFNAKLFKIMVNFLNLKPVNWNFVKNQSNVRLFGFSLQPYLTLEQIPKYTERVHEMDFRKSGLHLVKNLLCNMILCKAKLSRGKTFTVFQPIVKVFPLNHLLCTVHDGHGLMHQESFPVNSVFYAQLRKFQKFCCIQ